MLQSDFHKEIVVIQSSFPKKAGSRPEKDEQRIQIASRYARPGPDEEIVHNQLETAMV